MRHRICQLGVFVLIFANLTAVSAVAQAPNKSLIVPGQSVGELKLGDSADQFRKAFAWKPNVDEHYHYPAMSACPASEELHWLDAGNPPFSSGAAVHDGVYAYLRNSHVFQIAVATPLFEIANGITEDSSPDKVKQFYPNMEAYWLVNRRSPATDRDFIYWVDETKGIAFEFYYARNIRKRLLHRIYVFAPSANFLPQGCVQYPQAWRKITPYSLEPPVAKLR